uniref:Putative imaginal disc growth factor 4 n=1 Tax=Corethrella appendiculata TaxID=1370023 RepID=U5EUT6_9DIPT
MWFKFFVIFCFAISLQIVKSDNANSKVICYYDGSSFLKEGLGKVTVEDIEPALSFCTHLVYGYAGLKAENNKLVSLNEQLDLDTGKGYFRAVNTLKRKFPNLKVILSVGGDHDNENREKYLTILESSVGRTSFINSAYTILKSYTFDGLNLAWEFPKAKPKKIRSSIGSFFHKIKKTFTGDSVMDDKAEEHREEFTAFVREIKNALRHDGFELSLTVLPHTNASVYYDVPAIINNLDYVIVGEWDIQTPDRNPKEADLSAPIYQLSERQEGANVQTEVSYWLSQKAPASKLVIGIPAYGRAWKLTSDSGITGVPPLPADGPAPEGPQTKIAGLLSWPEICAKLPNPGNTNLKGEDAPLRKVNDPTKRFGPYAFRIPDDNGEHGIWVSYDDPDSAGNKGAYVKSKNLGGIAILDLSMDDFRGTCSGDKFPILRAAKYQL